MINNLLDRLKDILFPKFCVNCKKEGEWLCEACFPLADFPQGGEAVANLDDVTALFSYGENTISNLILMFKYKYLSEIADIFEKIIDKTGLHNIWQDFVIIPVPLHARRQRERGFNQAEILAGLFAKKLGLSINKNLHRPIYTVQQAKLPRKQRQSNLKNAFVWGAGIPPEKVLLVDDVYTTGATMAECAKVLKENGVKVVWGLVLARG